MKKFLLIASILGVFSFGVIGCGDKKDEGADKMAAGTPDKMAPATPPVDKMSGGKMAAADEVKDKVEAALKADDKLKAETGIMVEHKDGKVTLKGDVADNDMKKEAGATAMKAVTDAKSTDKVMNSLMSKKH